MKTLNLPLLGLLALGLCLASCKTPSYTDPEFFQHWGRVLKSPPSNAVVGVWSADHDLSRLK